MTLRVGTIVRPFEYDEYDEGCFSCNWDEDDISNVCVGIILICDDEDAKVNWVQICTQHLNETPRHQMLEYPKLYEIGQIA